MMIISSDLLRQSMYIAQLTWTSNTSVFYIPTNLKHNKLHFAVNS